PGETGETGATDAEDVRRQTGRFGYVEPGRFDPRPPPLPTPAPPPLMAPAPTRSTGRLKRSLAILVVGLALLAAIALEGPTRRPESAAATTTTAPPPLAVSVGLGPRAPKAFYCPEGS